MIEANWTCEGGNSFYVCICDEVIKPKLCFGRCVEKLLDQHSFKSAAGLLRLVRLYVCINSKTSIGIQR